MDPEETTGAGEGPIPSVTVTSRFRILMIEDNPGDARLMQEVLSQSEGVEFEVEWAETLAEGVAMLKSKKLDIVLLDLSLPDSRGVETFSRMLKQAPHLPIIVLTGFDDEDAAVKTVAAGAQDYLVKGEVDDRLLVRAILYAIERKKTQQQLADYAEQLRQRNREMEEELGLAREIQQSLIPNRYPTIPSHPQPGGGVLTFCHRYIPTAALAGDFFEILDLSDTEAGVFICDVMGHGVRSALVAAMLHALVEDKAELGRDPSRFLSNINTALITALKRGSTPIFATAFYLVFDLENEVVHYASAGHPRPLRLHRRDRKVDRLPVPEGMGGPALGIFDAAKFPACSAPLHLDDLIILFTDGIYEAENSRGEAFLDQRLIDSIESKSALPQGALFDGLLADVRSFSASGKFDDDVCLVGVEFLAK